MSGSAQKLLKPSEGWTNHFIHPPYKFNIADSLVTNFHLPKTSLLIMTCAFAGYDLAIEAYKKALINDATNEDARHNLQLALQQQKQEQQKEKQDKEKQKEKQNNDKEKQEENKPKPQQSNISKEDAEQKLQALGQKEKELQDKMHKVGAASANKQDKDW